MRATQTLIAAWWISSLLLATSALAADAAARELNGVNLAESVTAADGTRLTLNGAGVRSKFVVDVYVAALYLPQKTTNAATAGQGAGAKRIQLHFLREVDAKKIVAAWDEGFAANTGAADLTRLRDRIERFNALFPTLRKGDIVSLEYVPARGTQVSIGAQERGLIAGEDFAQALFRIWLGEQPVSAKLKASLLGS